MRKALIIILALLFLAACGNDKANNNGENDSNQETISFRNIDIVLEGDDVLISGEMNSWDGNFYYHVLSGEKQIIEEEKVEKNQIHFWANFEISLSKEELQSLTEDVPHIVLYGKDDSGEDIDPNYVPIDLE